MGSLLSESKTRPVSAPDSALTVVAHVPIQIQQTQNDLRMIGENRASLRLITIRLRGRALPLDHLLLRESQRVAKRSRNAHRD